MTESRFQRIIPLPADALQAKYVTEQWAERFSPSDCQTKENEVTFDNWRTSTTMRRKNFHNRITGHKAVMREYMKDGTLRQIVLMLEDETGTYVYNGIPSVV